ncbi:MAG: M28 family peptidase [Bacteroidales bacterium]|nr:M28 family peptidase [Bacteroidales bacterium]
MKSASYRFRLFLFLMLVTYSQSEAQDTQFVRKHLVKLCGPEMYGRGCYKRGDGIAADYLSTQMKQIGIKPFAAGYQQPYSFNINCITEAHVKFNGQELGYAKDYVVDAKSSSLKGNFKPVIVNTLLMIHAKELIKTLEEAPSPKVVLLDSAGLNNPALFQVVKQLCLEKQMGISALIEVFQNTPNGATGRAVLKIPLIQVSRASVPADLKEVEINIVNEYNEQYPTQNVIGYLPGQTDQFIVYTAHYDAMGSFGEGNYYPGAEDNASGTAMVLDLARHYLNGKKPYYSIAFMLFSGEEAGLMGSSYYVNHPLFPLEKVKLVINLDMVMTGDDGAFLFNGNERPNETAIVHKINEENHYLKEIVNRDAARNSDHHPFHEKGVPAIFFLTKGVGGAGHTPDDSYDKLSLYTYEKFFRLVVSIPEELKKQEVVK